MLQISHLSFSYQNQTIFQNLNLSLSTPKIIAIVGDNGVGKTTLLRLIAGELRPDDGAIQVRGDIGFLHQSHTDSDTDPPQSGGERTRAELVTLFRTSPRILLLDEPTNNLDHESRTWLIDQLRKYRGLVLVVSHDRTFIDAIADKVLEIQNGVAQLFSGNYSDFSARCAQVAHEQLLAYEKVQHQKRQLAQQLRIANDHARKTSHRSFNKARDESKLLQHAKRTDAQKTAGKILHATQSKLDQLSDVAKPMRRKVYSAQFTHGLLHQKTLLKITDLTKTYADKTLFKDLSFTVKTGERIRILGRNGAGKSTLFQIIMNRAQADSGTVQLSPETKVGYISQDGINFDLKQSFLAQRPQLDQSEIYRAAVTMDFSPHDINCPIRNLSRGQLTKLAILELILNPLDLVILDEITNHLDIRARENIELALQNYRGAILATTHDEIFAEKVGFDSTITLQSPTAFDTSQN